MRLAFSVPNPSPDPHQTIERELYWRGRSRQVHLANNYFLCRITIRLITVSSFMLHDTFSSRYTGSAKRQKINLNFVSIVISLYSNAMTTMSLKLWSYLMYISYTWVESKLQTQWSLPLAFKCVCALFSNGAPNVHKKVEGYLQHIGRGKTI